MKGLLYINFRKYTLHYLLVCLHISGMIMVDSEARSYNAPCTVNKIPKLIQVMLQLLQNSIPVFWEASNNLREYCQLQVITSVKGVYPEGTNLTRIAR